MDEESIKAVWQIQPHTIWWVMCGSCGTTYSFDMTIQDVDEALVDDGWELRHTGPWCPGCCDDQRRDRARRKYSDAHRKGQE
jgi:hypothetical protein